jgi:hypothetical protein
VDTTGTVPISADALLVETRIEEAFNTAMTTRCVQKQLLTAKQRRDEGREGGLFNSILMQKEQEFQAALLMKKAKGGGGKGMKAKLAAKKKQDDMIKNSNVNDNADLNATAETNNSFDDEL